MRHLGRLFIVRHGESVWNITDKSLKRETRFTGWADIPLSEIGEKQATASGHCLASLKIPIDAVFTSLLQRARLTYQLIEKNIPLIDKLNIPIIATWRLNERHYGALVGLSKQEAEDKMGKEKVMGWRRSWDL